MPRPQGSHEFGLSKQEAWEFYDTCLNPAGGPSAIWPYSRGRSSDWKKSAVLAELKKTVNGNKKGFFKKYPI